MFSLSITKKNKQIKLRSLTISKNFHVNSVPKTKVIGKIQTFSRTNNVKVWLFPLSSQALENIQTNKKKWL